MFDYESCILPRRKNGEGLLKLVAVLEESNLLQLLFKLYFFLGCNVLERRTVGTKIQTNQLHDALASHNVAAEVADDVDNLLAVVL